MISDQFADHGRPFLLMISHITRCKYKMHWNAYCTAPCRSHPLCSYLSFSSLISASLKDVPRVSLVHLSIGNTLGVFASSVHCNQVNKSSVLYNRCLSIVNAKQVAWSEHTGATSGQRHLAIAIIIFTIFIFLLNIMDMDHVMNCWLESQLKRRTSKSIFIKIHVHTMHHSHCPQFNERELWRKRLYKFNESLMKV